MKRTRTFTSYFLPARVLIVMLALLNVAPTCLAQQPVPSPASATTSTPSPAEIQAEVLETLKQLRQQVAELQQRTKELEARLSQPPAPHAASAHAAAVAESTNTTTVETGPAKVMAAVTAPARVEEAVVKEEQENTPVIDHSGHGGVLGPLGLQIRGFGDVSFRASDIKGQTSTFGLGQLNLFVTSRLSDKMGVLAEIAIESGQDNTYGLDLERILLQYAVNDYFNFNVGRYHSAIGYYNTAFHHGTWFQTAAGRPLLFSFEDAGGILPIHNVGISVNGRVPSGKLGLSYVAEIGNGRTSRSKELEPVQISVDENNGKAFNLGLQARPRWVPGFQAGFSLYRDRLTPQRLPKVNQMIWAAHAVYQTPSFEFLNEGVLMRHTTVGSNQTITTSGFYSQVSQRFFNRVRPYFRYDYVNVPLRDLLNGQYGRRSGPTLGVRYELGEYAALKLQYARTARNTQSTSNAVRVQFAFTF